jgi:hypothetical protein
LDGMTVTAEECQICKDVTLRCAMFGNLPLAHLCKAHLTKDSVMRLIGLEPLYSTPEVTDAEKRDPEVEKSETIDDIPDQGSNPFD